MMAGMSSDFLTIRDYFRHAVSEFRRAGLVFGHGTRDAVDEAAFIVLEGLNLPIDDINPWLDARLSGAEHARLAELVAARIATRKPAAYLLNKAYIQDAAFYVDERVIVPRSYIGEMLARGGDAAAFAVAPERVERVLDLCTGSGCLAILAAQRFANAEIDAVDVSRDALDVAERNVAEWGMENRVRLHLGDLFAPLGSARYDLIISNPPYVDAEAMARLPPEFRAEPALALAGGDDGLEVVRRILDAAATHLTPLGVLVCEIGRGGGALEADYPDLEFVWLDAEESAAEVFMLQAAAFARAD